MSNQFSNWENYLYNLINLDVASISSRKASELEWFIKKIAVEAVTASNKDEFNRILEENDYMRMVDFLKKYVPDFKEKFSGFLKR